MVIGRNLLVKVNGNLGLNPDTAREFHDEPLPKDPQRWQTSALCAGQSSPHFEVKKNFHGAAQARSVAKLSDHWRGWLSLLTAWHAASQVGFTAGLDCSSHGPSHHHRLPSMGYG